jgi:ComF family protein
MPIGLERVRSVGPFEGWLRGAIVQFKYHGEWSRGKPLATSLAGVLDDLTPCDLIIPVPLHPVRLRQRGFNQSLILAQHTATILGVPFAEALVRSRRTTPQVTLGANERRINVTGAFRIVPDGNVAGQSIILIDDVITTGSTLAACADVLYLAGASVVSVATIAREL